MQAGTIDVGSRTPTRAPAWVTLDVVTGGFATGGYSAGGPLRDVVLLNSGAALLVAGRVPTVEAGIELAARSIDSSAAQRVLDALVTRTNTAAIAEAILR